MFYLKHLTILQNRLFPRYSPTIDTMLRPMSSGKLGSVGEGECNYCSGVVVVLSYCLSMFVLLLGRNSGSEKEVNKQAERSQRVLAILIENYQPQFLTGIK